mgnify:CR=1 FL=1
MSDLQKYIEKRKLVDPEYALNYDSDYESFKIGVLLKQARLDQGITQDELADKLNTKKPAISRIENHAEDIRLSTLEKYAKALNRRIIIQIK